ncbi:putative periplasmic lipoprotein [Aporhodopirellula aestuarii]|uniref:Secreted protein n=1 Tax=Aporhodopirellula aestuarii TaxID=2950107 RepID=A0ABT0U9S2_9BACT|nr:hypothetical protein [Aporhodopirellula aestuarii]MCM2373621.1 hypothetical protein [Aporhodopirellula aestuarii]
MKTKNLLCLAVICLLVGCSSSDPASITDGASQQQIDDYNALIEAEAKSVSESPELKRNE